MNEKTNNAADGEGFSLGQWGESKPQAFERFDLYMHHVSDLVKHLHAACVEHRLPFHLVVGHTQHETGDTAVATCSHFPSIGETTPETLKALLAVDQGPMAVMTAHEMACMRSLAADEPAGTFDAPASVH